MNEVNRSYWKVEVFKFFVRVEYGRLYSGDCIIVKGIFSSDREAREAAEDLTARKLANGFRMR